MNALESSEEFCMFQGRRTAESIGGGGIWVFDGCEELGWRSVDGNSGAIVQHTDCARVVKIHDDRGEQCRRSVEVEE